ncbi:BTNL1 protein, partial [Atractosteus spatula]|nr:BTNL1 protein [Atractosteus spatula]
MSWYVVNPALQKPLDSAAVLSNLGPSGEMRTLIVLGLLAAVWRGLGTEGFSVQGPKEPLVARPGGEVLLPCSVYSTVPLQELEVEWLRTDPDTLVLLFSEGESRPESQHQSYRGRADLFPQEIPRGNFSLQLTNITAEDTGVYRCAVHTAQGSGETTVELKEQGGAELLCGHECHPVEWMRTDPDTLVLLFSKGESRPESQHQSYRDRAELFPQEIPRGNFSLRLKDVRTEDKGEYMCRVHTDSGSANTTAELEQLRFSTTHIWILLLALSALGAVLLTSVPTCLFFLKKRETSRGWLCCLVNCVTPGLLLSVAFILWGQTEGFLQESVTCATVSVLRILLVSMMAPYSHRYPAWRTFSENPCQRCPVLKTLLARFWNSRGSDDLLKCSSVFMVVAQEKTASVPEDLLHWSSPSLFLPPAEFLDSTGSEALKEVSSLGPEERRQSAPVSHCQVPVQAGRAQQLRDVRRALVRSRRSVCCCPGRLVLVALLTVFIAFSLLWLNEAPESDRARAQVGLYVLGSSVLPAVSAIALTAELILKAEKGRRTLTDLRLVVLPCQILLVVCWLVLLMYVDSLPQTALSLLIVDMSQARTRDHELSLQLYRSSLFLSAMSDTAAV